MSKRKPKPNIPTKWRRDSDYKKKLSPEDRKWLIQFEKEYYDADLSSPSPIHTKPEHSKAIYDAQNAAARDMSTVGEIQFQKHHSLKVKPSRHKYYNHLDWLEEGTKASPEDALIALIEK